MSDGTGSFGTVTFIQAIMSIEDELRARTSSTNVEHEPRGPALSAAEWSGVLGQPDGLKHLREQFGTLPFSTHAIAALLLYEQSFGFTQQDVTDEEEVSEYCAVMAAQNRTSGDVATAAKFELLGGRHKERAARIAALLPPVRAAQG